MPVFRSEPEENLFEQIDGQRVPLLSTTACDRFGPTLLGLGDISRDAEARDTIAAVFDLQGFTKFCGQIEPQLSVPIFLSDFLSWLMEQLKSEMIKSSHLSGVRLWSPLPFFVKFLGDGLLVLWDSSTMGHGARYNIVVSATNICKNYKTDFLSKMREKVVDPPEALRCGVARGTTYSVGDGNDFVGSCINMAARLQKLPGVTFAFNRRGFDSEKFKNSFVVKRVPIRGIGDRELVGIRIVELSSMSKEDRKFYGEVDGQAAG